MHADDAHAVFAGMHPLGRMGTVADIVQGVLTWKPRHLSRVSSSTLTADKAQAINTIVLPDATYQDPSWAADRIFTNGLVRQARD